MSTLGDVMSILGCSVHRGDIMMHVGEQVDKSLSSSIENPNVLNILMVPPTCIMVSPTCIMISPRCTEHPPMCS